VLDAGINSRFVETDLEESLKTRTEQLSQFRDLGPPDLVHYRRVSGSKEVFPSCTALMAGWSVSLCGWSGQQLFGCTGCISPGFTVHVASSVVVSIGDLLVCCPLNQLRVVVSMRFQGLICVLKSKYPGESKPTLSTNVEQSMHFHSRADMLDKMQRTHYGWRHTCQV
jgi:hypothetical protein